MQTKIGSLPSFSLMEFKTVNLIVAIVNKLLYNSTIQFCSNIFVEMQFFLFRAAALEEKTLIILLVISVL